LDRELLIAAGPGEWRAALLEDGVPAEIYVERGDRSEAGSIHLGRVRRIERGLGAALVDIGDERPAFLPQSEVVPRGKRLHEGARVMVQIRREAQAGKAARATMRLRLRRRGVELIAGAQGLHGGEELECDDRDRVLAAAGLLLTPEREGEGAERGPAHKAGVGLKIVEPMPIGSLLTEAAAIGNQWREIYDRAARLDPPSRVYPLATFAASLANTMSTAPSRIFVDDPGAIPDIRRAFPGIAVHHRPEAEWPVDLDEIFDRTLSDTVALPGGGSLNIETAHAAVLIDVDTGTPEAGSPQRAALAVNLAAAVAIARQIRLRNLGGGIVVDFVGLDRRASRERVRTALAAALASDPAAPQLLGWTRLGHFELVRPRRGRPPLAEMLLEYRRGAAVKAALTVAYEALRALRREARAQPGRRWLLTVAPDVAAALGMAAKTAIQDAEQRFAREVEIEADCTCAREQYRITPQ
jgi:ribonuclease G